MKTLKHILVLGSALLMLMAGCQKETVITPIIEDDSTTSLPYGNIPSPRWSVDPDYDYGSSMTAVVCVDLAQTYTLAPEVWSIAPGDKLGAFVVDPVSGNAECVGVATPTLYEDGNDNRLFFLYIVAPQGREDINLWYYSERFHNIFQADCSFPFENGGRFGTIHEPAYPMWWAQ